MSRTEGRLVHGEGYSYRVGHSPKLPAVELAAEDYRKLARLAKVGDVKVEIESRVHYEDADHNADNGAGSIMVMEAARILAKVGMKPRRTIRFALWAGEEQGAAGAEAYVEKYLAVRPAPTDPNLRDLPAYFVRETYPVQTLPGFNDLDAYCNIDNGSGRIRGIYAEGNLSVVPVFREWLAPFAGMSANAVVARPTGSTDHVFMSRLGLPAPQFIQDPLDYGSRVHHTDLDTYDHLRIEDMKEGAVVLASVLLAAAGAEKAAPRKPVPREPKLTDPFAYPNPAQP